jgi:hypothetical protein
MEKRKGPRENSSKQRVDKNDRGHATYNNKSRGKITFWGMTTREITGVNKTSTWG